MPLSITDGMDDVSLLKAILQNAAGPMSGLVNIGIGIASIFLLFVVFIEVSSIMSGNKFQLKMLTPLLIYLCICNFHLISKPVTSFISTLQGSCVKVCENNKQKYIKAIAGAGNYSDDEKISYYQAFWTRALGKANNPNSTIENKLAGMSLDDDIINAQLKENAKKNSGNESDFNEQEARKRKGLFSGIGSVLNHVFDQMAIRILNSLSPGMEFSASNAPDVKDIMKYGFVPGALASVLDYLVIAISFFIKCLGGISTGVVIAFAPITWAFAILPGHGREVSTWFIRLCQFALYSPICALCESSLAFLFYHMCTGAFSFLLLFCICIANILVLLEVPSLASMVIEGASGAISASQSLNTLSNVIQNLRPRGK